jgi:GcrA cell cycle regulator
MARGDVDWNKENLDRLKSGVEAGDSYSQIADRIPGCTRSGAIGKARRMGYSQPAAASKPSRMLRAPAVARAPSQNAGLAFKTRSFGGSAIYKGEPTTSPLKKRLDVAMANAACEPLPTPDGELAPTCTLVQLGAHMCKWPIGDPMVEGFGFCGRITGDLYCDTHLERAWSPVPKNRPRTGNELARSLRRYV